MRVPLTRLAHRAWARRRGDGERGAVAVMTVVLLVVMVGMAAVVLDFGNAYWNKRQLSAAADAAALAAARDVALSPTATTCTGAAGYQATARTVAEQYVLRNQPGDGTTLSAFSVSCDPTLTYVEVRAQTHRAPTGILSGIFGVTAFDLSQTAVAAVGTPKTITGLRPFAVCTNDASQLTPTTPGPVTFVFDNGQGHGNGPCGSAPGNWGTMDFDGGNNSAGDLATWTEFGYDHPLAVPTPPTSIALPGDPGNLTPGKLEDPMNAILDKDIIIPVFSLVTEQGQNASYRVVRFMGVHVCGWQLNHQSGTATCFAPSQVPNPPSKDYMQVTYVNTIAVGDINTVIQFDDPTYAGLRVVQLIK